MTPVDKIGSAFLRRILKQMKKLGINQTELARRMNVSRPYVTAVLKHDVNISFLTAAKLARALQMDFFPDLIDRSRKHRKIASKRKPTRLSRASIPLVDIPLCRNAEVVA